MTCEHCGRPVAEGRSLCTRCDSEHTAPAWTQSGTWRATPPRVSITCSCASYAGVKVHAVGCPQANDALSPHGVESATGSVNAALPPTTR
jgi:hypothetical protein